MCPTDSISILIADELPLVREGIAALCAARPEFSVLAQCADGVAALNTLRLLQPDVAVLDVQLPLLPALEVIRVLQNEGLSTRMILMAPRPDRHLAPEALRQGAHGIVLKTDTSRELLQAVEAVMERRVYLAPSLQLGSLAGLEDDASNLLGRLSPREHQVFSMLVDGVRAKEIADRLSLSPKTVDTYRSSLMRKLDIHDLAGLVRFAIQRKLIEV